MTSQADGETFRCAAASAREAEPLVGTAPADVAWLFVEHAGPWGHQAVADSRLDEDVKEFLAGAAGVRVQLVRRHGGVSGPGVRVFLASLQAAPRVWSTVLDDVREVLDLDLAALARGADPGLPTYDDELWLVCTNGRRDRCCAELGRPVTAALAARWPEETWETTHLGGHRFAATMLALPSATVLGRLDAESAVDACRDLQAGAVPSEVVRGRAGLPGHAQVALEVTRSRLGLEGLADALVELVDGDTVTVRVPSGTVHAVVTTAAGEPVRQSCADLRTKPVAVHDLRSWVLHPS